MGLRRELLMTLLGVILLNLTLAFGAIGLLDRMGPAIERILERNMISIVAVTDMLEVLASSKAPMVDAAERARFQSALSRAQANVTESGEGAVVESIAKQPLGALSVEQLRSLISNLHTLRQMNFDAMTRADAEARRLGWAGGWAAALIGFLSLLFGLSMVARLRRRVVEPLEELERVLDAAYQGDFLRRCRLQAAPGEVEGVLRAFNTLLDDYHRLRQGPEPQECHTIERLALHAMMERQASPMALVAGDGELLRANQPMLEALAGEGGVGLRDALMEPEEATIEGLEAVKLPDESGVLCFLKS